MARQARVKDTFGQFLISQNGNPDRQLFRDAADREKFVSILKKAEKKYQFKLYAYCLSASDHYDIVLDVNGSDLSSIMKSINIAYAMYAKYQGKLFKDRYKSVLMEDEEALNKVLTGLSCEINTSSYHQVDLEIPSTNNDVSDYFEGCQECLQCMDSAKKKLTSIIGDEPIELMCKDKDRRNELIIAFRQHSTLSLKELGQLFGGLSESSICKVIGSC